MGLHDRRTALVVCGGWAHPADMTGPPTAAALAACGFDAELATDLDAAGLRLGTQAFDLLVVHACSFQMHDARYTPEQRAEFARLTPPAVRVGIAAHLAAGRPMLALHTAPISFDDWPEWPGLVGATWSWERSNHPPPGRFVVEVDPAFGVPSFEVVDELYRFVEPAPDAHLVATATDDDGMTHPIVWLHEAGPARVAYSSLGHDETSLANPGHRALLAALVAWLCDI